MARQMERERLLREKEFEVRQFEGLMGQRAMEMEAELNRLRDRKSRANNNLAGATWEQSISTEMSVVVEKYKSQRNVDSDRLKALQAELARLKGDAK